MNGYLTPASLVTSGHLAAGFVALLLAARGEFSWAAGCIVVAAVLDYVDGLVARRSHAECDFGAQLDSLADVVSFGAAPATAMYLSVLESVPVAGVGACLGFLLCGAWRLARYPLVEHSDRHFVGLPITSAGAITAVLAAIAPPAGLALASTLALALLMVSTLPFPTLPGLARLARPPRGVRLGAASGGAHTGGFGLRLRLRSRVTHRRNRRRAREERGARRHHRGRRRERDHDERV